jgi:hypothetical protein
MRSKLLKGKRVIYIGGIDSIMQYYRRLVEEKGGTFHYHHGKSKQGKETIEKIIKTADTIFCPVNIYRYSYPHSKGIHKSRDYRITNGRNIYIHKQLFA